MKKRFLNKIRSSISKQYPNYNNDKLDEIMYGVEGIYLTITKCIVIFTIALILGIFKELLLLLLAFNFIRLFAFGMHASKSSICLIFSSALFIGGAYLCKTIVLPTTLIYILYLVVLIIMILYSPSDTVKRPLIRKNRRLKFKILSVMVTTTYFITTLLINNNLYINCMIFGLVIECILIIPITYKAFNMPYKNYVNYGLNA
ncbi:MAG: accessory gene regulator AgrB [Bacilli bacterium]|nr:accessory gene regulator AgrB [Bacilli bacterium]